MLYQLASPLKRGALPKETTMNAPKIARKILAALAVLAALSTVSGCVEYVRGPRYHRYYR